MTSRAEGRRVGPYRIVSLVGAGGMGEVFRAYDEKLQREVAIKMLPAAAAGDASAGARLLREARAAAALNHPHICTIHEVGDHDGQAFIAMELVDGQALHRIIPPDTGLPIDQVLTYGIQIADALAHAHERGVLHRDLKAANVVITTGGRAKVLDFGLAKRVSNELEPGTETVSALTIPGAVMGTLAYMAPEQLRGQPADARSDVWALGVVLYELSCGSRPFSGRTPFEVSSATLHEPPRPLPAHVPVSLQGVITRCLEKEPGHRYAQAGEVLAALEAVKAGTAPASLPAVPIVTRRQAPSRTVVAAAGLLVAAAAIAANVGGVRDWFWTPPPRFTSIAVLPIENVSGEPDQDYLAAGMHQALITELAQLPGLTRVIARASTLRFRNATDPAAQIAAALGVTALVTGGIRREGDRVMVSAELIDASTEGQIWGDTFDRRFQDVISVQNDVVSAIARAIEVRLRPADEARLSTTTVVNPETYEAYLRGMHELNVGQGGNRERGLAYLEDAIRRDPADPHAYVGLAKGYTALGHSPAAPDDAWTRARAAAERALGLAPDLADAHAVMADVKFYYERDWAGAERAFERANELNPNLAMNHYHYAWYLLLVDRLDEATVEHERARDLDPMTPGHHAWLGEIYRAAGRYDDAIAAAKKSLEINPNAPVAWNVLAAIYSDLGRHDEAIAAAERAVENGPPWTFGLGIVYARAGRPDDARRLLTVMEGRPETAYNAWARAMLHGVLDDRDAFFELIDRRPQHAWVPWVRIAPELRHLRSDPRFAQLMTRLDLPMPRPADER